MQTFYLIRHGQKQPTAGEPELTQLGHQQAAATAQFLTQFPIDKIFSSPSMRTQQTAQHISDALKLPIQLDTLLRERANWGDDPSQSFPQFLNMWGKSTQDRSFAPHVGDSSIEAGQRMEQIVDLIRSDETIFHHVVLVTHGGVIGDFLRNIFGDAALKEILMTFQYRTPGDYNVHECSITEVVFDETPTLKKLANIDHLEALKLSEL